MSDVSKAKQYIKYLENRDLPDAEPLIIDCDPGIDDAMALLLLSDNLAKYDVKLICSCAGNTPIDITTQNMQFFATNFFPGVRIAKGSRTALVKVNPRNADDVHGKSGMGAYEVGPQDYPVEPDAIVAMADVLKNSEKPVTLVTLGPLTNVAKLVILYPDLKDKIKEVYTMIGSMNGKGNITSYAEFNSYYDPEAFDLVVKSGVKLVINPMQLGNETRIPKAAFEKMPTKNLRDNFVKVLAESINETVDPTCVCIYDPNTIVGMVKPELYDFVPCNINVYTAPKVGGKTVITEDPNGKHLVQKAKDIEKLKTFILRALFNKEQY
ncbi:MAG: nucleoside hydrolase [Clostridia bacterium]|nr:nucleoside hydrolase [Clostridia bacterium]